ncbi:MAG: hypothetical protein PHY72_03015 [Candidatus Pacebacteria bacterium]|nr:hypothetical protein [Candidatus Paceibacterota bacterium]
METVKIQKLLESFDLSEEVKTLLKSIYLLSENFTKKIIVLTRDEGELGKVAESKSLSEYVTIKLFGRIILFLPKKEADLFPRETIANLSMIWSAEKAKTAILII